MGLQISRKATFSSLKSFLPWWTSHLHLCLSSQRNSAEAGMDLLGVTYSDAITLRVSPPSDLGFEVTALL